MARYLYAVTGGDVLTAVAADPTGSDPNHKDLSPITTAVTVWSQDRSTQITGLRTADGSGSAFTVGSSDVSTITPDAVGRVCFWGPDTTPETKGPLFVRDGGGRYWKVTADEPTRSTVVQTFLASADAPSARTAIGALGSVNAASLTNITVLGHLLITDTKANILAALGLDTAGLTAQVSTILTGLGYQPAYEIGPTDPLPSGAPNKSITFRLQTAPGAGFAFTDLGSASSSGTSGTTVAVTPSAAAGTDKVYAHIVSECLAATVSGGTNAQVPTSVTGGGKTWTKVPNTDQVTALNQLASSVWVGTGTGTTGAVTATFPSGLDYRAIRLVQATGGAGTVAQNNNSGSTASTSPTVTLPGTTVATDGMLGFYAQNSGSQTINPTTGSPFSALGTTLSGSGFLLAAFMCATGVNSITLTASGSAQKLVTLLELS